MSKLSWSKHFFEINEEVFDFYEDATTHKGMYVLK